MNFNLLLFIIFISYNFLLWGQIEIEIIDPWESDEVFSYKEVKLETPRFASSPIDYFYTDLIGFYQSKISSKSIQRCPFHISCSHYTKEAIKRYGSYTGILYFIDRNLYRENIGMRTHYSLRKKGNKFKLDDSYYLLFLK